MSTHEHDDIFEAAAQILLKEDRCVTISFYPGGITIRFPTTRKLAEHLGIPHYYVLPRFGAMERDGLIRRTERVGISTTAAGTERLLAIMAERHGALAEEVLGAGVFTALRARAAAPGGDRSG
jgi:Mn-dependent DtxR family transcriptional regulator